ncbi:alkaline phosphatase [bacterium]|nr:MAG: alkaline phosphatase [bacterium]
MKRRDLLKTGALAALGLPLIATDVSKSLSKPSNKTKVRNIIFMVSDGMSSGTLALANILSERKFGKMSPWMQLYKDGKAVRGLMETSSASSIVTDSAAASSSWGGGMKVNNGSLNVGPNGEKPVPILQKFKKSGKSVGCVTSVPITHATPAGFCVNVESRGDQSEIAVEYLPLGFDVMLGAGTEYFDASKRKDKRDVFAEFVQKGYNVVKTKAELMSHNSKKPVLGVFQEGSMPYAIDHANDETLKATAPTLAEMTKAAIAQLEKNPNGFVMQVEGGKVDWAAHGNDTPALVYDQLAFEEAVEIAVEYAEKTGDTLVIITTDHGNSNPGVFYGKKANDNFDRLKTVKHSNEWCFKLIQNDATAEHVIDIFKVNQGITLKKEDAQLIADRFKTVTEDDKYDNRKLPFYELAMMQRSEFSVHFADMNHSGDHVELAMFGAGSEGLKPFTVNTELHQFMLDVTETVFKG